MIELKNIEIGYTHALLKAELLLDQGKVYALIGKNGIGKTTFLQTLAGNIAPIKGTISINSFDLAKLSIQEKSKIIAQVETRFPEINFMTGFEFVALGRTPFLNAFGRLSEHDQKIVVNTFSYLNIEKLMDKFTSQMSDGERQMLLVAKSLTQETAIILMDEPMAFLDYSNKRKLISKLIHTSMELNKCIILSSHDVEICLDFNLPILLVAEKEKSIHLEHYTTKKTILDIAFPEKTN